MENVWFEWHKVVEGDTLEAIAREKGKSGEERYWRRIWLANRQVIGEDPTQILQTNIWLKLPSQQEIMYQVQLGDTLSTLAYWVYDDYEHGMSEILKANPWLEDPDMIQVNSWINIP